MGPEKKEKKKIKRDEYFSLRRLPFFASVTEKVGPLLCNLNLSLRVWRGGVAGGDVVSSDPDGGLEGGRGGGVRLRGGVRRCGAQGMRSVSQSSVRSWNGDVASQRYQASGGSRAAGSAEGQLLDHIPPAEIMPPVLLAEPPRGPYRDPTILPEISSPVADAAAAAAAARSSPASGSDREGSSDPTAYMVEAEDSSLPARRQRRRRIFGGAVFGEHRHRRSDAVDAMMTDSPLSDLAEVANLRPPAAALSAPEVHHQVDDPEQSTPKWQPKLNV